jgi:hypothetical protein
MGLRTRPSGSGMRPVRRGIPRWFSSLDHVILLAGIATVFSLCYLLYVIMTGGLSYPLIAGTAVEAIRHNITLGAKALIYALWVLIVAAGVRHYRTDSIGYLAAAGGAATYFGLSYVVTAHCPYSASEQLQAEAQMLVNSFHATGMALIVVGLLRVIVGRIIIMTYRPSTAQVTRIPGISYSTDLAAPEPQLMGRPSLLRKCWELHFCRGSVRQTCPRAVEGVACWRRRSGCYCDQELASQLLSSVHASRGGASMQVAEEVEVQQRRAQDLYRRAVQQRSRKAARKLCQECPIYNEHQKYKYRALSWLAYPVAVIIVALIARPVQALYQRSDEWIAQHLSQFNVLPHQLTDKPLEGLTWLTAENIAVVIVGVLVLAIILQLAEAAVFRFKL